MSTDDRIIPFTIQIPQPDLDDLADRLARTRFSQDLPGSRGDHGVGVEPVRELVRRWREDFDWRAVERRLNEYPQYLTEIDGQRIHFLHLRSGEANAFPLLLAHGWPGSFVEFLDLVPHLLGPRGHAGTASQAFDLSSPPCPVSPSQVPPPRPAGTGTESPVPGQNS